MVRRHVRLLQSFVAILGASLLAQGLISVVLRLTGIATAPSIQPFVNADYLHGAIHIGWGLAMLVALRLMPDDRALMRLTLLFGVFYIALAVLGTLVHHPFGLELGPGENGFHFIVGPLALLIGARAWRAQQAQRVAVGR